MMSSFSEAFKAIDLLHGREVADRQMTDTLHLAFMEDSPANRALLQDTHSGAQPKEKAGTVQESDSQKPIDHCHSSQKQNSQASQQPKLTCKYEIDPFDEEASKAFLLSKRIIGPKGSNMKKIIEECFGDRPYEADALKLRLRGKGSGFKEGPLNKGSRRSRQSATSRCICASARRTSSTTTGPPNSSSSCWPTSAQPSTSSWAKTSTAPSSTTCTAKALLPAPC